MQDKTAIGNNENANTPSKAFREYIESLVEEIVLNNAVFSDHKKYLQRYSQEEGLDYTELEKNLTDFFDAVEELKSSKSKSIERFAKMLAKDCYLEEGKVDELLAAINEAREKEAKRIAAEKKAEKERLAREKAEREAAEEAERKARERRNGYGECDYDNGRYEGNWKDGNKNGPGTVYWNSGDKDSGNLIDDKCDGEWLRIKVDGKKQKVTYKNGEIVIDWHFINKTTYICQFK